MNADATLLREYAENGSEPAFAELVRGHVDLVYGAALRRTGGDAHRAAEVAQRVFTQLARHAGKLSRHTALSGWLHTATRNAALNLMISDQRRKLREAEAVALDVPASSGDQVDWDRVGPVLDDAIDELAEGDRAAVVLRFLEQRAFAEIGRALQLSEDAARMRTERALHKLRTALARRGITSTAAALGTAVSSQALVVAPSGLAVAITTQALATGAAGVGLLSSLSLIMSSKIITTAAIAGLLACGLGFFVTRQQHREVAATQSAQIDTQSRSLAALQKSNQVLKAEVDRLSLDLVRLTGANSELAAQKSAPPAATGKPAAPTLGWMPVYEKQRLIMNYLKQVDAARAQVARDKGQGPSSIHELVGIDRYIKTIRPVGGEDYSGLSMEKGTPLTVTTEEGMTVTYDPSGATTTPIDQPPEVTRAEQLFAQAQKLAQKLGPSRQRAVEAFRLANQGKDPAPQNPQALVPFFATAQEGADFVEWVEAQTLVAAAQKAAFEAQKLAPRR